MADKINQDTERSNGFPRSCTVTAAWDRAGSLHSPSSLFPPAVSSTWAPQGSECKEPSWGTSCFSHSMKVTKSQQHESGFLGLGVTGPVTHMNKCVWARTAAVGKACPDFHQSRLKVFSVYLLGFFFFFFPLHLDCRILVPRPGIEPRKSCSENSKSLSLDCQGILWKNFPD